MFFFKSVVCGLKHFTVFAAPQYLFPENKCDWMSDVEDDFSSFSGEMCVESIVLLVKKHDCVLGLLCCLQSCVRNVNVSESILLFAVLSQKCHCVLS